MPIYEYVCPTCGTFEEMQKFSDPVLTACPKGHAGVERKISASGFILKGSGWYLTDYARKGDGKANGQANGKAEAGTTADAGRSGGSPPAAEAKPTSEARPTSETKSTTAGSGA